LTAAVRGTETDGMNMALSILKSFNKLFAKLQSRKVSVSKGTRFPQSGNAPISAKGRNWEAKLKAKKAKAKKSKS